MSVKERLIQYLNFKKITKTAFCRQIGVSAAFISSMRVSIQPDKIDSIALNYPDLNTGWLLTGNGKMLNTKEYDFGFNDEPAVVNEDKSSYNSEFSKNLLKQIDRLTETLCDNAETMRNQSATILKQTELILNLNKKSNIADDANTANVVGLG